MSAKRLACLVVLSGLLLLPVAHAAELAPEMPAQPAAADAVVGPTENAPVSDLAEPDPSPDVVPDEGKALSEDAPEAESEMLGGTKHVTITDRIGFGMVGTNLFAEYGIQAEIASNHFGVKLHWANWQPVDNNVDFSFSLGFGFHYYPFGKGPNGLYVGPGFQFTNISQTGDPMREAQRVLRTRLVKENLAANPPADGARMPPADPVDFGMIINHRTGVGRKFNLLTPMVEVGFRHSWPEHESPAYFTLGAELMLGYAVSDSVNYYDSGFTFTLNPQVGVTW